MKNKIGKFIISVALCEGVGAAGGFITAPSVSTWYTTLTKPSFNPPGWIFGPVWTALYFLIGVALFLVWTQGKEKPYFKKAVIFFGIQLLFNFLWSLLFFGLHSPGLALIDIVLLWISIVLTIVYFSKLSRLAAWLLVPYVLWVSFAGILNYVIYTLN